MTALQHCDLPQLTSQGRLTLVSKLHFREKIKKALSEEAWVECYGGILYSLPVRTDTTSVILSQFYWYHQNSNDDELLAELWLFTEIMWTATMLQPLWNWFMLLCQQVLLWNTVCSGEISHGRKHTVYMWLVWFVLQQHVYLVLLPMFSIIMIFFVMASYWSRFITWQTLWMCGICDDQLIAN